MRTGRVSKAAHVGVPLPTNGTRAELKLAGILLIPQAHHQALGFTANQRDETRPFIPGLPAVSTGSKRKQAASRVSIEAKQGFSAQLGVTYSTKPHLLACRCLWTADAGRGCVGATLPQLVLRTRCPPLLRGHWTTRIPIQLQASPRDSGCRFSRIYG